MQPFLSRVLIVTSKDTQGSSIIHCLLDLLCPNHEVTSVVFLARLRTVRLEATYHPCHLRLEHVEIGAWGFYNSIASRRLNMLPESPLKEVPDKQQTC